MSVHKGKSVRLARSVSKACRVRPARRAWQGNKALTVPMDPRDRAVLPALTRPCRVLRVRPDHRATPVPRVRLGRTARYPALRVRPARRVLLVPLVPTARYPGHKVLPVPPVRLDHKARKATLVHRAQLDHRVRPVPPDRRDQRVTKVTRATLVLPARCRGLPDQLALMVRRGRKACQDRKGRKASKAIPVRPVQPVQASMR